MIVCEDRHFRVEIPAPFPVGEALDRRLKLPFDSPRAYRAFLKAQGIADGKSLHAAAERVSRWTLGNHARFARAESLATARRSVETMLAQLAQLRARIVAHPCGPSTATWDDATAAAFSEAVAAGARESILEWNEGAGLFPYFLWLPPPCAVYVRSREAKEAAAMSMCAISDSRGADPGRLLNDCPVPAFER